MDIKVGSKNVVSKIVEYAGSTNVQVHRINYMWTINNFSYCSPNFYSPAFTSNTLMTLKWQIFVKQTEDFVSLYVCFSRDTYAHPTKAKYKFSIINTRGEKTNSMEIKITQLFKPEEFKGFHNFISRHVLIDEKNGLIHDDKLKILCEIDVVVNVNEICGVSSVIEFNDPELSLIENLESLLNTDRFSDVTLVVGDYELPAHKAILATRSEVFAAMFKQKMDRITIADVAPEVVKEMLHFIYTGKAPNLGYMAGQLLGAADKYALHKLKVMCEKTLCVQISFETVAESLIIAHRYNAYQLKMQTISFIGIYFTEVAKTEGWKKVFREHFVVIANLLPEVVKKLNYQPTN